MFKSQFPIQYILRMFTVFLIVSCVVYITLYGRVAGTGETMTSRLTASKSSHDHQASIDKITRNMTILSDKVNKLHKFLKQNGFELDVMTETTEFPRVYPNESGSTSQPTSLLTLFTTIKWSSEKESIFNNTFLNWASLKPVVNPVLFTDEHVTTNKAKSYGWSVVNSSKIKSENGLPVLKHMYLSAMKSYRSYFYCYANSDILFGADLIKTLVNIYYYTISTPSKHVFITGIRHNVVNVTKSEVLKRHAINQLVNTRGKVFILAAEDYFITDRFYPWKSIPEVVIGNPAYDNWLVMNAREKRHFVVDASKTITIVHQSLDGKHYQSHVRDGAQYNADLLRNMTKINLPYHKGFLNCIEQFTDIAEDTFVIRERRVEAVCN